MKPVEIAVDRVHGPPGRRRDIRSIWHHVGAFQKNRPDIRVGFHQPLRRLHHLGLCLRHVEVGQIAEATGLSERAVHTSLTELRLRGQIVTTRAPRGSMPAAYRVVTPEAATPDHPEVEIR